MSTEAQKRASRKYYLKNKEKFNEWMKATQKRHRRERKEYKERIDRAIEYINKLKTYPYLEKYYIGELLNILQGE